MKFFMDTKFDFFIFFILIKFLNGFWNVNFFEKFDGFGVASCFDCHFLYFEHYLKSRLETLSMDYCD